MKKFALVRELFGDGDRTEANPGTFHNVLVDASPCATECDPDQVVVAVHAATVNYPDLLQTVGGYQHKPSLPYTPGSEFAGVVTMRGSAVAELKVLSTRTSLERGLCLKGDRQVGDRVAGTWLGSMATEVVVPAAACWQFPAHYSFAEAAAFTTGYSTAYHCLVERAGLRPGESVLIHGATGGMGATVIATGGTDSKLAVVKSQGADYVLNYSSNPEFRVAVKELTEGEGVDVVFDPVGGSVFEESLRSTKWGARICVVGFTSGDRVAAPTNLLLIKGLTLMGCRAGESIRSLYQIK